jgi:hypothetical protein
MTPTIIRYPIPGNESGGLLHIHGKRTARHVILFCGGFPDGVESFAPIAQRLAASVDDGDCDGCFVGVTCWPGFDDESYRRLNIGDVRREGFSFLEVTCCIKEAAKQLFLHYNKASGGEDCDSARIDEGDGPQFTVIFHDWGVLPGLIFVNRSIMEGNEYFSERPPDRVVLLDVLLSPHKSVTRFKHLPSYTVHELIVCMAYRGALAFSFTMRRYISDTVGLVTIAFMFLLLGIFRLLPTRSIDNQMIKERNINPRHLVYMAYPYFNLFRAIISNDMNSISLGSLPLNLAKTPVLYMYGAEKNVVSHVCCVC